MIVYIREAHTQDEWQMPDNVAQGVCYSKPTTVKERLQIATDFLNRSNCPLRLVVDPMDDPTEKAYNAWPERLYIVEKGKIAYVGGRGPFGYNPREVAAWLNQRFPK